MYGEYEILATNQQMKKIMEKAWVYRINLGCKRSQKGSY